MKKLKYSIVINFLIVVFVILGCISMFTGFTFMKEVNLLQLHGIQMFKFYTVDSNILMGVASLVFLIYEFKIVEKKIKEIPRIVYILKFVSTVTILLTFLVTIAYLGPLYGFYAMYNNTNLFFHLIIPILSLVTYVFFEKHEIGYKHAYYGIIPMLIYAVYYSLRIFAHLNGKGVSYKYDFYGFLGGNLNNVFIVAPVILVITYLLSIFVVYLNKNIKIGE